MPSLTELGSAVGVLLKEKGQTVAVAESSTGGLVCAALLSVPGASAYFVGGGVIYTQQARAVLAAIESEEMAGMRASTEPYALLLARRTRERLGTTWGLAETGATGPTGNRYGDAAGHTCIAVAGPSQSSLTLETGQTDREANMWAFAAKALEALQKAVEQAR